MPLAAASAGVEPQQVEAMPADQRAMVLHLTDGAVFSVGVGVEAVTAVGGDHL